MNVPWLFIRNSHLTLALKPLSNTELLHTRKCYKNKAFRLLGKPILRNICHCQIQTLSADCKWDSHVQQFLLTHSAHTTPFFLGNQAFQRESQWPGTCPVSTLERGKYHPHMDDPGQGSSVLYNPNIYSTHPEYLATTAVSHRCLATSKQQCGAFHALHTHHEL